MEFWGSGAGRDLGLVRWYVFPSGDRVRGWVGKRILGRIRNMSWKSKGLQQQTVERLQ